MVTMKEIKNAANPAAKAIEFIEWKAEIADNKIIWNNPTNDPEKDAEYIRTFENSINKMFTNLSRSGLEITEDMETAYNNADTYLRALRLSDGEGYTLHENCAKKSTHGLIIEFKVDLPTVDKDEEEAIINKINEVKEEAVFSVDFEAKQINETENHYERSNIDTIVRSFSEGGFYAKMRAANVNYHYSEKALKAFTSAKHAYMADVNDISFEVYNVFKGLLEEYSPRFDRYGVRI